MTSGGTDGLFLWKPSSHGWDLVDVTGLLGGQPVEEHLVPDLESAAGVEELRPIAGVRRFREGRLVLAATARDEDIPYLIEVSAG